MMKVALLSQWTWILSGTDPETVRQEPGGAMLSLGVLNSILKTGDRVVPGLPADSQTHDLVESLKPWLPFTDYRFMDTTGPRMRLIEEFSASGERYFKTVDTVSDDFPISLDADTTLLYLSFESGTELTVPDIASLRRFHPTAFIYLDIQQMADVLYQQFKSGDPALSDQLDVLFRSVDAIQMNTRELQLLFLAAGSTEKELYKRMMRSGSVKFCIVTKSNRGVVVWEQVAGQLQSSIHRPGRVVNADNPYGCGHVFGPVFACELLRSQLVGPSIRKAMNLAELCAAKTGFAARFEHIRLNGALL